MNSSNFYLSVPNADGVFMGNKASEKFEEYSSLYEFELFKDDKNKANFWLAEEAIAWALDDIDKRIKPACKSENYSAKKKSMA